MPPFLLSLQTVTPCSSWAFPKGSCHILQTLALKVYFLTAINESIWNLVRKQRERWGRAWQTFKKQCCPAVLTLKSQRHHLPRNTCPMRKASSIFHWRTESSLMTNTPQKTHHWPTESDPQDRFDGFFPRRHWHSAMHVSLKEATENNKTASGSQFEEIRRDEVPSSLVIPEVSKKVSY